LPKPGKRRARKETGIMDMTVHAIETIVSNPKVRGGQPIIAGTTLRVLDVAAHHIYRHYTPEELARQLGITLAQVHAALAYYYEHKDEIDARLAADLEFARKAKEEGLGRRNPPVLR
jgi:uncharacterized protein (DUF433 family)